MTAETQARNKKQLSHMTEQARNNQEDVLYILLHMTERKQAGKASYKLYCIYSAPYDNKETC